MNRVIERNLIYGVH